MDVGVGVRPWTRTYVRIRVELSRLTGALRRYWKRILVGAFVGGVVSILAAALVLAWLEVHGVVSKATADDFGPIIVYCGIGIGALNAYVFRPERKAR